MEHSLNENPMIGANTSTKISIEFESEEYGYTGNLDLTYAPDKLIMDNQVLVEFIRVLTENIEQEEETIMGIGDNIVSVLKPNSLYVTMKVEYATNYTVEVNYEFDKTGRYKLKEE